LVILDGDGTHMEGIHIDMATVPLGQLWDVANTATVSWGHQAVDGRIFGVVQLVNGDRRTFWDATLIEPYVKAWRSAKASMA
jgi:hypothetical protein